MTHFAMVEEILGQGDAEKFSPWGAPARNLLEMAMRALALVERSDRLQPVEGRAEARPYVPKDRR